MITYEMKMRTKGFYFFLLFFFGSHFLTAQQEFEHRPDIPHCMLIILNEDWAEPGEISAAVVKYNIANYRSYGLKVSLLRMPYLSNLPVIYVREFRDEEQVLRYYQRLLSEKPDFMQMNIVEQLVPLSNANYNQILIQQGLQGYEAFFSQFYAGKVE